MFTNYSWRTSRPQPSLHYIIDAQEADKHLAALSGPVGFDLEWRPSFKKGEPENPVALVQLANSNSILLIQISRMSEFPQNLRHFLENPKHPKAGVGIQNDAKKIFRDCNVSVRNCVDLSLLARSVDNDQWKGKYTSSLGLARLIQTYENSEMPKGKVSRTNWELDLSDIQVEYAANDAHAGFLLYQRLSQMASLMTKIPDQSCYIFNSLQGIFYFPDDHGKYWAPHNPDYDPGPPPPPRPPKDPAAGVPVLASLPSLRPSATKVQHPQSPNTLRSCAFVSALTHPAGTGPLDSYLVNHQDIPIRLPKGLSARSSPQLQSPPTNRGGHALSLDPSSASGAIAFRAYRPPRRRVSADAQGTHYEAKDQIESHRRPQTGPGSEATSQSHTQTQRRSTRPQNANVDANHDPLVPKGPRPFQKIDRQSYNLSTILEQDAREAASSSHIDSKTVSQTSWKPRPRRRRYRAKTNQSSAPQSSASTG